MERDPSFLGRGWAFPPAFAMDGAAVEMVSGHEDVHQSLQILLRTTPGERIMLDAFGCDLASVQFEPIDRGLVGTIEQLVRSAILTHEPRVKVDAVEVHPDDADVGTVMVGISYTVLTTNSRFNMVFPFYLLEAGPLGP